MEVADRNLAVAAKPGRHGDKHAVARYATCQIAVNYAAGGFCPPAWEDPAFAEAVRGTERRNLVMAGVTTDVCMVGPAVSAAAEGFNVKVVCDSCGSGNAIAEEMSWRRMDNAGVYLTSTNAMVAELVKNCASPAGAVAFPLLTAA